MSVGDPERPAEMESVEETVTELEADRMRAQDDATGAETAGAPDESTAQDLFDRAAGAVFGKP